MSSPNLNIVTLLGSCLTYSSAYLFGIHHQGALAGRSMETLIQVGEVFNFVLNMMRVVVTFILAVGTFRGNPWNSESVRSTFCPRFSVD